jgi:hypothetical protein
MPAELTQARFEKLGSEIYNFINAIWAMTNFLSIGKSLIVPI